MERYCIESFRNLSFGDAQIDIEEFEAKIKGYFGSCNQEASHYVLDMFSDDEWKVQGFSDDEKYDIMHNAIMGIDIFLYDDSITINGLSKMLLENKKIYEISAYYKDIKMSLATLISSSTVAIGVINELILALCKEDEDKVKLFDEASEDEKEKIKEYIRNRKKGMSNMEIPFDVKISGINEEINKFGADVIYLWYYSKKFRNLFKKVETYSQKYEYENFFECFIIGNTVVKNSKGEEEEKEKFIKSSLENNLILDKLVGGSILLSFERNIYPIVENCDWTDVKKYIIPFIEEVLSSESNYIACEIFKVVGEFFIKRKCYSWDYKAKILTLITQYLHDMMPMLKKQYNGLCKLIATEINDRGDLEFLKLCINEKMKRIKDEYRVDYNQIHIYYENNAAFGEVAEMIIQDCYSRLIKNS